MVLHKSIPFILVLTGFLFSLEVESKDMIFNSHGVAIHGFDSVAYFTRQQPTPGNPEITYAWMGSTWQFDSEANRDLFIQAPERYAPQYGGYCAYAMANGSHAPTNAFAWSIIDDKLYLNFSSSVRSLWRPDAKSYIRSADKIWSRM